MEEKPPHVPHTETQLGENVHCICQVNDEEL